MTRQPSLFDAMLKKNMGDESPLESADPYLAEIETRTETETETDKNAKASEAQVLPAVKPLVQSTIEPKPRASKKPVVESLPEKSEADSDERPEAYSVGDLTRLLKSTIKSDPVLGSTLVIRGELSNVNYSSRGHVYFSVKDEDASIKGVVWANLAKGLSFDLEDGLDVYVTGTLDVYAPYGTYSVIAKKIEPVGVGALQLAYLQTKEKLEAEGLFDDDFKKPIPAFPHKIGLITSATGAVIHDMLRVLRRKNPMVDVLLLPVTVQGVGATESIARAIEELNEPQHGLDLLIVARGGGSFEDLFCFSEEPAVRAVFASRLPVITGIGHEPDFSLCDAVSDYSASTPTAAAESAVPDYEQWVETLKCYRAELLQGLEQTVIFCEQGLDVQADAVVTQFERVLERAAHDSLRQQDQLIHLGTQVLSNSEQRLVRFSGELDAFNPLKTISRGYSMLQDKEGKVVSSVSELKVSDVLDVRLLDGCASVVVESLEINDSSDTL